MNQKHRLRRVGAATLEFALFLPTIAMLFALLIWHGGFFRGMLETRVAVRSQAFDRAKTPNSQETFRFDRLQTLTEKKSVENAYQPSWLSMMPKPESQLAIVRGTWDRRVLPMDRPLHWEVMSRIAASTVQSVLGAMSGIDVSSIPRLNFDFNSIIGEQSTRLDGLVPSWLKW